MTYKEIVTYIEEIPRFTRKHSLAHTREMLLFFGKSAEWKEDHSCSGNEWKRFCMRLSGCDAQGRRKKHRIVYFTASGENE